MPAGKSGLQSYFGTKDGEPWYWNIINQDGNYYHLDLLHSYAMDAFQLRADSQMDGYVWDYSAYPACTTEPESEIADYTDPEDPTGETTEPTEPPTEPSEPTDPTNPTEESTVPTEPPAETPTENESDGTS